MRRSIAVIAALAAALAGAIPAAGLTDATEAEAGSFIVLFDEGTSTEQGVAAVEAAGGQVIAVNEAVGLATVVSENADFAAEVTAEDGVYGAASNEVIGTSRPEERKFDDERLQSERDAQRSAGSSSGQHGQNEEPLAPLQWDMAMIHATAAESYARQLGDPRVTVGVLDTGIDAATGRVITPDEVVRRDPQIILASWFGQPVARWPSCSPP